MMEMDKEDKQLHGPDNKFAVMVPGIANSLKMASVEEREEVKNWENMMACCLPCGYVWFKEGTGSACFINLLLGCFLGSCCVNVCHACTYIKEAPKPGSPCDVIVKHGSSAVVLKQPGQL